LRNERPELKRSELVLFSNQSQRPAVAVCSPRAEREGIRPGQPLAEAKVLLPRAVFLPAEIDEDREALRQLALDCQRFSPLVGLEENATTTPPTSPECLLADVAGCTHLWNGEENFIEAVHTHWVERGYQIQLALAPTVGAAWALAHATHATIVPDGEEAKALAHLSTWLLRLPADVIERLEILGLTTIGHILQLPRESLASRFGTILPQRLDHALGDQAESFVCERLREPLTAIREWEYPVDDRFALGLVCRELLRELLAQADDLGMGLLELEGEIRTEHGPVMFEVRLVRPCKDERHLAQLIELQLERQTWSGGAVSVRWSALRLGRLSKVQGSWFDDESAADAHASLAFNALVDRLSSRLAPPAVLRVQVLPEAQPELACRLVPWTSEETRKAEPFALSPEYARGRPLRLMRIPQPIAVSITDAGGPPVRMVWQGQSSRVIRSWGPERIATGWWRARDVQRDYYRIECEDGTHAWVFCDQRTGRWSLHGFFD
jgi:protein ImuB